MTSSTQPRFTNAKYPVWLRVVLIVGLSAALWTGIILAVEAL